ncbi:MAG: DUF192 domain-containing protein [Gammaproteobacteria bacterium]|nr:DUF192 domain-containing protein [Gammaproteobacteria bacterium]
MRFSASIQSWRFSASIQGWRGSALTRASRFGALALVVLSGTASAAASDVQLPLRIGPHAFEVELAATPQQRQRGLMGRTHLAADGGMLFVFEQPGRHCFWMRDTPLPLSIAFIDSAGRIASLADMQPRSETLHCPSVDVRYALEVRQGEFRRRGITARMQVGGLPQ